MDTPQIKVGRSRLEIPVHPSLVPVTSLPSPLPLDSSLPHSNKGETVVPNPTVGRFRFEKPLEQHPVKPTEVSEKKIQFCCQDNCCSVYESLERKAQEEIKTSFVSTSQVDKRNKLLNHIQAQSNLGRKTDRFYWKSTYFCNKTFSKASLSSIFILDDVLKGHKLGIAEYVNGNKGIARFSIPRSKFIIWMRCFLRRFAQSAPDCNVQVLSHWITKAAMFEFYSKETTPPQIAEKTFYEYLKRYFGPDRVDKGEPQVRISKHSSHSVCDQCLAFSNARRCSKTQEELESVNSMKSSHLKKVSEARMAMETMKQEAIQFPENSLVLQLDGMDNHKSYCPRELVKGKKNCWDVETSHQNYRLHNLLRSL